MADEQKLELWDEEKAYDEKIAPLMTRIIEICKEHKIPFIASFAYANTEQDGEAACTSYIDYPGRRPEKLIRSLRVLRERPSFMTMMITSPRETKT